MKVKKKYEEGEGGTKRAVMGGGRRRENVLLHKRNFIPVATKREIGRERERLLLLFLILFIYKSFLNYSSIILIKKF